MAGFSRGGDRGGFERRSSSGRSGGFGRGRSGGFGGSRGGGRRPTEMFDATCTQCGKRCQVPFRPTGSKPVLCSECFGSGNSGSNFSSRNSSSGGSQVSSDQINQINAKLDKILLVLQDLELDVEEEDEDSLELDDDEDDDIEKDL